VLIVWVFSYTGTPGEKAIEEPPPIIALWTLVNGIFYP
jgi:hypothetical protein